MLLEFSPSKLVFPPQFHQVVHQIVLYIVDNPSPERTIPKQEESTIDYCLHGGCLFPELVKSQDRLNQRDVHVECSRPLHRGLVLRSNMSWFHRKRSGEELLQ